MFITLTTDMGLKDYYVATLKGAIYSELPDAKIIDISHNIPPFDITHAAFVIKNSFKHFPKNTIHVIGIDAEPSDLTRHIIVETQDQFDPVDDMRLYMTIMTGLRRVENIFLQIEDGILDDRAFDRIGLSFYRSNYGQEIWQANKQFFDREFVPFFEKLLKNE